MPGGRAMSEREPLQWEQDPPHGAITRRRLLALGGLSAAGLAGSWLAGCTPGQPAASGAVGASQPAAGGAAQATGAPIPIAFHMPLTGPAALLGAQCRAGAQMAVDEVNAAGGVNGRRFEVSVEDSGADN